MEDATGHLMPDHLHMMISVPLKYAVSQMIWYIKGKSVIHLVRVYGERKQNFVGRRFWARGYFVSTAGLFLDFGMVVLYDDSKIIRITQPPAQPHAPG